VRQVPAKEVQTRIAMYARNGVWGTCADCPTDSLGHQYPELCTNRTRYDHHLSLDDLVEQLKTFGTNERPDWE